MSPRPDAARSSPLRVCLFTDTLGDVNGVSRFIRTIAEESERQRAALHVITSTRFSCPDRPNVHNVKPVYSRPMPGYATLDVVVPSARAMCMVADRLRPDVVHVSTPGPVGSVGRRYALKRGLPLVGTYHTDFPAYISHLFNDDALTWICDRAMRRFYAPFARVFSRSNDYAHALQRLGVEPGRIDRLLPGIDTGTFSTRYRDVSGRVWQGVDGVRASSTKVLYVGRVSVEKYLPLLTRVWMRARTLIASRGGDAQLIIIGDGPYRAAMSEQLALHDAVFAGFRHGVELSTLYASSDLFVFPSTTDTLGQVVMEAQSAGLPVIVTDQGGPSEVVDNRVTGFVLPASGAGAESRWAETIANLVLDPSLRQRMGQAGAAKIAPMSIRHSFEHFWHVHERVRDESQAQMDHSEKTARAHEPRE